MKVQSNYSVNFGRKRLYKARLNRIDASNSEKNEEVYIAELEKRDKAKIEALSSYWRHSMFGYQIINEFVFDASQKNNPLQAKKYYVLENPNSDSPEHIKAFAVAQIFPDQIYVPMIQTEEQILNKKELKGGGSLMLYSVIKLAEKNNKASVSLVPTEAALKFYEKQGFKPIPPEEIEYIMYKQGFKDFETLLENKYSISPVE